MSSVPTRVVSFNMHGETQNVPSFKAYLNDEQIICLQEVDDISGTRSQYSDYPYVFTTTNKTTSGRTKYTSIMILSKVPFAEYEHKIIQTDPGGDKWERNAQYVVLKVDASRTVHLFHYHNTYNWHKDNSQSEREGLTKFLDWVRGRLGIPDFTQASDLILAGDFNLQTSQSATTLLQGLNYSNRWVDYVCGSMSISARGSYPTATNNISDHNAVWAVLDSTLNVAAVVGPEVTIYNLKQSEYLYAGDYAPYDDDRRRVFTWRPGNSVNQGNWRLEPVSYGAVRIFNTKQLEYLYAADYEPFDSDRRRVFTWRPGVPVSQGNWRIDDKGDQGKWIYNLKQGEYLYAGDYKPFDDDRRRVFTWRPGNPVTQGYWRIG